MRDSIADRDTTRIDDQGASEDYATDHLGEPRTAIVWIDHDGALRIEPKEENG